MGEVMTLEEVGRMAVADKGREREGDVELIPSSRSRNALFCPRFRAAVKTTDIVPYT